MKRDESETFTFPTDEQRILAALDAVLNEPWVRENILPTVAKRFAGRKLVGRGVDLTWELACHDAWKKREDIPAEARDDARMIIDLHKADFIEALKSIADR